MLRFCDLVFSTLALVILAPALLPIMVVLRLTGEGEVFFRQNRVGKDGKLFSLLKFATMLKDSPKIGTGEITLHNDPRVLPVGRWLRKTKLNELPQLVNVWRGDMSLVGPRPQTLRCFGGFPPEMQPQLTQVRPGLSGLGSILFRDEERMMQAAEDPDDFYDNVIMPYKAAVELWYIEHQNLKWYFLIIVATAWVVLVPSSRIAWRWFPALPTPPEALRPFF